MKEKLEQHKDRYGELSNQAKVLLTQLTNIKKIPNVKEEDFKKGEFEMCKAFTDMKEEGRIEGRREGISETKRETALKMLQDGKLSIDQIVKYSGLEIEEVERLAGLQMV